MQTRYTEQRHDERVPTRMFVQVQNGAMHNGGMVVDISSTGMGIEMHNTSGMNRGDYVEIHSQKLGYVSGTIRWVRPRRIGVNFDLSTNTSAKIAAFFKYYS